MNKIKKQATIRGQNIGVINETNCLLGVSISDNEAWVENARAGWTWVTQHFAQGAILVGDSLNRITIEITEGYAPAEAQMIAMERGQAATAMLSSFCPTPKIIHTSSYMADPKFLPVQTRFVALFKDHQLFRKVIEKDAIEFCSRQERRGRLRKPFETALSLSIDYLLQEVAVYEMLAEDGWNVEAYFGSELFVLSEIMKGHLPDVSGPLERRAHISLKRKRDSLDA